MFSLFSFLYFLSLFSFTFQQKLSPNPLDHLGWFHVPQSGSSFFTTIAHWSCPTIPENLTLTEPSMFQKSSGYERCEKSWDYVVSGHNPISDDLYNKLKGNWLGMFRNPTARTLSGYFNHFHDCQNFDPEQYSDEGEAIVAYAKCVANCSAHMLIGKSCGEKSEFSEEDLQKARRRLREYFGFVGITEEWNLSVCLWHAMFGGKCVRSEFQNSRQGQGPEYSTYLPHMKDFKSAPEWEVYLEARHLFVENLIKYNVTKSRCMAEICPVLADI